MKRWAIAVSAILHPLVMPLACFLIAARFDWYIKGTTDPALLRITFIVVALSTIAFPGLNMLLLRWYGVVSSLEMPGRAERLAPFVSTLFFFVLGYYLLRRGALPPPFYSIFFGSILALLTITLISMRWKISAHATGVAGLLGTAIGLFQLHNYGNIVLLCVLIFLAGLTLSARLVLRAHTPAEVYAGALVGFGCIYFSLINGWLI